MSTAEPTTRRRRGAFSSRKVFIFAAIGSAVGLGNIWRFPYVAYENGGGAFMIPYLVALLGAGLPFLLLDYALGHKYRGSAPLSFARLRRGAESLGWWQVGICFLIAIYYAAIIAWALRYMIFSVDEAWGAKPEEFLFETFLQAGDPGIDTTIVVGVLVPLAIVWGVVVLVMALGVEKGIGKLSLYFIPVLVVAFAALVVRALTLDGAATGLDALFTPHWAALTEPGVWGAAFGQIFFSLSIGFGVMITYASYVDEDSDMSGAGMVVGFANSGFELLAGIGVFAALGFMAQAQGMAVDEVAADGLGLAFVVFPTLISEAPAGALIGVLFFGSLVIAGLTSLVSVLEVVVSAVRDKLELGRVTAALAVSVPAAVVSLVLFSTTSGVHVLDIIDHFINQYGILLVAVVSMLVVAWSLRALPDLADHLNRTGSLKLGRTWFLLVGILVPAALTYILVDALVADIKEPYAGYPGWMLGWLGWGAAGGVIVLGVVLSRLPWRPETPLTAPYDRPDADQAVKKEEIR
ncbi:sodium-dependent transporter [Nocardioides sp. zg-536]|uniref:Transporter n=1 Tax=Nocardioides faecalis TaxID=2803858 RepID=A0A939BUX7_9ACTN|nr:sodium-dependent transporter [Nocardioides faecalis]MBM9458952.1 sodium-dependent transporter [Nocardioides faecalis]MBS4753946.1 sodium-dependent transporter [Nocardioides faecalis]QVI60348.1 sodium-dependent transporter [Nocardioides faecalis]